MKSTFIERVSKALMSNSDKDFSELLGDRDHIRMQRIVQADRLLLQWRSDTSTAKALVRYFKARDVRYSLSTAYLDISYAKQVFGAMRSTVKDYERFMIKEYLWSKIRRWENDAGNATALVAALKLIASVGRLDKSDDDGIDRSLLGRHPIILTGDVRDIGLERDPNSDRFTKELLDEYYTPEQAEVMRQKYKSVEAEDVHFELLDDNEEGISE